VEQQIHQHFMRQALRQAEEALAEDEVPVGAIIVRQGKIIAAAHNQKEQLKDPTAHAEMIAITQAANSLGDWRLEECALYVTLEPCPMCAGAIVQARLPWLIFGALDPKSGAVRSLYELVTDQRLNHRVEVTAGIEADRCGEILSRFFEKKRQQKKLNRPNVESSGS
jgi:tRNA(adenine34) deaminase